MLRLTDDAEGDDCKFGGGGDGVIKEFDREGIGEAIIELDDTPSICPSDESAMTRELDLVFKKVHTYSFQRVDTGF